MPFEHEHNGDGQCAIVHRLRVAEPYVGAMQVEIERKLESGYNVDVFADPGYVLWGSPAPVEVRHVMSHRAATQQGSL